MESKAFRGESGEVVRGFLSIGTFFTAIPVGLATVLLALLATWIQARMELPTVVMVPALLTVLAPLTGLFAMAARSGNLDAGFFEALAAQAGSGGQAALGFTLRYGLLQVAWSVPVVLLIEQAQGGAMGLFLGGPSPKMTLAIWAGVALVGFCLAAPTLTLLVATRTNTVGEAFSPGAWRWVLSERRADLGPYLASAIGAMTLFVLASIPALALALPVAMDISPRLAQMLAVALPALPFATAPILVGRLAGAFVGAEPIRGAEEAHAARPRASGPRTAPTHDMSLPDAVASRTHAALAGVPRGMISPVRMDCPTSVQPARSGGAQGVPLGVALARAHQLAETDAEGALAELESLQVANPRNPAVAAELARVLRMVSRGEEALQMAGTAIRLALAGGAGPIAHDVFRNFVNEAAQLNLEPAIYEQLGRILTARREYAGASWCFRAAAALGGEPKGLQRGLLAVAEAATEHGQHDQAAAVYEAFIAAWPDSVLARFAREGAEEARRRVPAASRT